MSDLFSPQKRSQVMAAIKGRDTKDELLVRRFLFRHGLRYRTSDRRLPGRPDIVLPKYRTVVFVKGGLWPGPEHWSRYSLPKTHQYFWKRKIERNRARDERSIARLLAMGWRPIVVWECELRGKQKQQETLEGLLNEIWDQ
ncbi:MAG: DNA mismatch endonuclease Vsr [Sphaerochaetaceae bacterium]|nr:DNA mismatch endonuclease Vsr [Sphaerochaetaceae bacterium]